MFHFLSYYLGMSMAKKTHAPQCQICVRWCLTVCDHVRQLCKTCVQWLVWVKLILRWGSFYPSKHFWDLVGLGPDFPFEYPTRVPNMLNGTVFKLKKNLSRLRDRFFRTKLGIVWKLICEGSHITNTLFCRSKISLWGSRSRSGGRVMVIAKWPLQGLTV